MGMPQSVDAAQLDRLRQETADAAETGKTITVGRDGIASVELPMQTNDVVLVTLEPTS